MNFDFLVKTYEITGVEKVNVFLDGREITRTYTQFLENFLDDIQKEFGEVYIDKFSPDSAIEDNLYLTTKKPQEPKRAKVIIEGDEIKHSVFGNGTIKMQDEKYLICDFYGKEMKLAKDYLEF